MSKLIDLTGKVYGRLTVISRTPPERTKSNIMWDCQCECSKVVSVFGANLSRGHTKSCGCLSRESMGIRASKHGGTRNYEYRIWSAMKYRCINTYHNNAKNYSLRGISVCDRWIDSYENFIADMGYAPSLKHSIDRINNDGNYEPGNCRWATRIEQSNNTRANVMVFYKGKTKSVADWARELNINYNLVRTRLSKGWPPEKAFEHK